MQVLYFAWMRERVGAASEEIDPEGAKTARELVERLCARDERYALAFSELASVRVAVDQEMADLDASIAGAREIAFFPPVTGG
ncbi:molybdopterin converting factor subunit 1 [Limibaculum sp. M0105]|uniref:Molybdopterin synthase sulfur carrier subunit n=1 Tax=Thermohalobaculum xanthum TaxID=2753746 RepID=A0A8J7SGB7_9RHOB|nr:molybdopterin converting factor subunit 1 [Thermohalobaculum xanthum]MBK0400771.1 molybdopterin converting factor subunit 1 [Thermohalobaculum xanthum]